MSKKAFFAESIDYYTKGTIIVHKNNLRLSRGFPVDIDPPNTNLPGIANRNLEEFQVLE